MQNIISTRICSKCAECCKNHPFVELSDDDINTLEQYTALHFHVFTNPKGKVREEYFLKFKENGDCFFLKKNNGIFFCGVYEARPAICKNYPSTSRQIEGCCASRQKVTAALLRHGQNVIHVATAS